MRPQWWFAGRVEFGVLGPLVVARDGREAPLGGPKQRAVLAMLLLQANEIVARDRLIDGLWGERPPPSAGHTLDNYVSRLRKIVGDDRLAWRAPGYALRVEPGELDVEVVEQLLRSGREALARGDAAAAAKSLREALALWRGPALADLQYESFAREPVGRLEERRLQALEERLEADLSVGRSAELVPELDGLVREQPFRERPLGQLMLALYRAGRQAEALAAFQAGRRRLVEELGLEPGPELQRLQSAILAQDPELSAPAKSRRTREPAPKPRPLALVAAAAAAVVATAALAIVVVGTGGSRSGSAEHRSSRAVALAAGAGPAARSVPLASPPAAIAAGFDALWFAIPGEGEVLRVDPDSGAVSDRIPVGEGPGALAVGAGSVWAAKVPGDAINRIDPQSGTIAQTVRLPSGSIAALTFGAGALWVADSAGDALLEIDPASGALRRRLPLQVEPTSLVVGDRHIWVADYGSALIAQVDRRTGQTLASVHVGNGPSAVAVDGEAVWVANALDSTVSKVGATTASLQATLPVGSGPTALAARGGSVWVANQYSASVSRIDARRGAVVRTDRVGGAPTALEAVGDTVWVGIRPLVEHRGGTLRLLNTRPIRLDPALQVDVLPRQSDRLTRSGLVAYNHVSGPAGTQLVPDLAISLPTPSAGGTIYTFRLRPGIRYSDGRPLRASDFRRAVERVLALGSEASAGFAGIVGSRACEGAGPAGCDLSAGIATDDTARTVVFHLRAPDPEFLTNAAFATPVPPGTPFEDVGFRPIPGTGPYKLAQASEREVRYVRNPRFRERSHAAQPDGNADQIVMRFGLSPEQQTREIEANRADWAVDAVPAELLPSLRARYPGRFHRWAVPNTHFLQFNTTIRPFDDVRVRKAVNLAIDRRKIVRLYGGPDIARSSCQVLPPGLPGYRPYCPFTRNPSPSGSWKAARSGPRAPPRGRVGHARCPRDRVGMERRPDICQERRPLRGRCASSPRIPRAGAPGAARPARRAARDDPGDLRRLGRHHVRHVRHLVPLRRAERPRLVLRPPRRPDARASAGAEVDAPAGGGCDLGGDRSPTGRPGGLGPTDQRARTRLRLSPRSQLPVPPLLGPYRGPALAGGVTRPSVAPAVRRRRRSPRARSATRLSRVPFRPCACVAHSREIRLHWGLLMTHA
jgi:DNA-binding SARP family transcriptional activator/ABC-type transport system substrate-binding protein